MSLDLAYYNDGISVRYLFMFLSEVQHPYLDVPGLSVISDMGMM